MRRLGAAAAAAVAVCLVVAGCVSRIEGTAVSGQRASTHPASTADLSSLVVGLDEIEDILGFPNMSTTLTGTHPTALGVYDPVGCVGAVFSGMALSYNGSGYRDYYGLRQQDNSPGGSWHWIDQDLASFDTAAAAHDYVSNSVAQWQQCAGTRLTFSYPEPYDVNTPRIVGTAEQSGCVATIANIVVGRPDYYELRALAAKSNIVVDLQFSGFDLNDEAATVMGRILERIPPRGVNCAFQA